MRALAAGSVLSAADDRIVIIDAPLFDGSTKLPVKVAPACTRTVSPGCAALSAVCRSPPAFTIHTWPPVGGGVGDGVGAGVGDGGGSVGEGVIGGDVSVCRRIQFTLPTAAAADSNTIRIR